MATLDQIRLQQLLSPFNNQTGIVATNQAMPMINNVPMINTGKVYQNLQNTDLVNQLIQENQMFTRPDILNVAGDTLDIAGDVSGGITGGYTGGYKTPRTISEQNQFLGRTFAEPTGIQKLLNKVGNIYRAGQNIFGQGTDLARKGIGSMIGYAAGLPLVGSALGMIEETPQEQLALGFARSKGDPYGYKRLGGGTLGSRQDPFGRNIFSFAGDYVKNREEELAELEEEARRKGFENLRKIEQDKLRYARDLISKVNEERRQNIQADQQRADVLRSIRDEGRGPSGPATTSQGVTSAQHAAFRN